MYKKIIIKSVSLSLIMPLIFISIAYGMDSSDFLHLRKPLDFSNSDLSSQERYAAAVVITEENKLRSINKTERTHVFKAISIAIKKVKGARSIGLISHKQKNELVSLLTGFKKEGSVFIWSNSRKILDVDYFLGPVSSKGRFIFAQELFNERWFKERGPEYLSDIILFRTLPSDELKIKIIGGERIDRLKKTVNSYLENHDKSPEERNLAFLYFEESLENIRPRVTERIKEVIEQLFDQGSQEHRRLIESLKTLKILRSQRRNWLYTTDYYLAAFTALCLGYSVDKDAVAHEMGHHISYLFNLKDPFSVFGNIIQGFFRENAEVTKGRIYARAYLRQEVSEGEFKKEIVTKWLRGETRKYKGPDDRSAKEDYNAGSFLAGLFLELYSNDKKRAMTFALSLTFSEWFNQTSKFLKRYSFFSTLSLFSGAVVANLLMIVGGWVIYLLTDSVWITVGNVIAILFISSFLLLRGYDYQTKLFDERIKRGDIKYFGPPIPILTSL